MSYNVHAPLPENRLADLDVSDLRGSDELGILAGGLSDLLQRVKNDISREHQRAQQELRKQQGRELKAAMTELRQRYGQAGRQWVIDRFSVDAMVEGNLGVYQRAIAKRRP